MFEKKAEMQYTFLFDEEQKLLEPSTFVTPCKNTLDSGTHMVGVCLGVLHGTSTLAIGHRSGFWEGIHKALNHVRIDPRKQGNLKHCLI